MKGFFKGFTPQWMDERTKGLAVIGSIGAALIVNLTGCSGRGFKIGGEVVVSAVDEQQTSSKTYRQSQPGICNYLPLSVCRKQVAEASNNEEERGS